MDYDKMLVNSVVDDNITKKGIEGVVHALNNGADVNAIEYGWTALMFAAAEGNTDIANVLLQANADVNIQGKDGWTALMLASQCGHAEIVSQLLQVGADTTVKNNNGWTAVRLSLDKGHDYICELIKSHIERQAERQDQHIFDLNI